MSPTIQAFRKPFSKDRIRLLSKPNLEKHLNSTIAKQLQGEEVFFQNSITDYKDSTDF